MLVGFWIFHNRVYMDPALMGKSTGPYKRLIIHMFHIANLGHKPRNLCKLLKVFA